MASSLTYSESIRINAAPETVYALVSDVTRTGEWSPVCKECWWDEGDGPRVGVVFTGRNVTPGRVFWTYRMEEVNGGTELTETWEFPPAGQQFFDEKYGEDAAAQVASREAAARSGIPTTLAAIKRIIEQS